MSAKAQEWENVKTELGALRRKVCGNGEESSRFDVLTITTDDGQSWAKQTRFPGVPDTVQPPSTFPAPSVS